MVIGGLESRGVSEGDFGEGGSIGGGEKRSKRDGITMAVCPSPGGCDMSQSNHTNSSERGCSRSKQKVKEVKGGKDRSRSRGLQRSAMGSSPRLLCQ